MNENRTGFTNQILCMKTYHIPQLSECGNLYDLTKGANGKLYYDSHTYSDNDTSNMRGYGPIINPK